MKVAVLYVPVIHEGYIKFFKKYADEIATLYIVGAELVSEHKFLEREIRAVDPAVIHTLVESLHIFKEVKLLDEQTARGFNAESCEVITADEQISKRIAAAYFPKAKLTTDTIFLRWDEANVLADKAPKDARVSTEAFDLSIINRCQELSKESSCWWRHVGAVIVKDGKVILEMHNTHVPSPHAPYAQGDPRDVVKAGTTPEIATTMHAEQRLITEAARKGISLEGTSLYTMVFPCAMCAKQVAYSGIKKCFYASGHASLDGEAMMRAQEIELIFIEMPKG